MENMESMRLKYNSLPHKNTFLKRLRLWLKKDKWNLVPVTHMYTIEHKIFHPEVFDPNYESNKEYAVEAVSPGETIDIDNLIRACENLRLKMSDMVSHHVDDYHISTIGIHIESIEAMIERIITDAIDYYNIRRTY